MPPSLGSDLGYSDSLSKMGSAKCSSATTAICVLTATSSSLCLSKRLILLTAETVSHTALCPHATHGRRHTKTTEHTNETGQPSPRPQLVSRPPPAPQSLCIGPYGSTAGIAGGPTTQRRAVLLPLVRQCALQMEKQGMTRPALPTQPLWPCHRCAWSPSTPGEPYGLPANAGIGWPETPQQGLAHKPAGRSCPCSLTFVLGQRLNGVTP